MKPIENNFGKYATGRRLQPVLTFWKAFWHDFSDIVGIYQGMASFVFKDMHFTMKQFPEVVYRLRRLREGVLARLQDSERQHYFLAPCKFENTYTKHCVMNGTLIFSMLGKHSLSKPARTTTDLAAIRFIAQADPPSDRPPPRLRITYRDRA